MKHTVEDGVRGLIAAIQYGSPPHVADFDTDSPELIDFLAESAYLTTEDVRDLGSSLDGGHSRRTKSRIRYLAALFPSSMSLHELTTRIHYVLDNRHLSISEVRDILRGGGGDIALEKVQRIGDSLRNGNSIRATADEVGVAIDTVSAIESFLGIAEQRRLKLVDKACDAVRYGVSTRKFAAENGITKSTAHNLIVRARYVLDEIVETY